MAWPPVLALVLLNNCVEFDVDRFKLSRLSRAPFPRRVEDIGAWNEVLSFVSRIATLANVFLGVYVSGGVHLDPAKRACLFLALAYSALFAATALERALPKVPDAVAIQRQRTNWVVAKLLHPEGDHAHAHGDVVSGDRKYPRTAESHHFLLRRAETDARAADELRLIHGSRRHHKRHLGVDRRPPHYRHETHKYLGGKKEDLLPEAPQATGTKIQ